MDKSIETIQAKDGETIAIRPFSLGDLGNLNRMSHSTSLATRNNYRAPLAQPRPPLGQKKLLVTWMLAEVKLALSSVRAFRGLLAFFPHLAYMAFVAVNSRNEIVGFRFYNIIGMRAGTRYVVEPGIVLRDDYQNKGIGTSIIAVTTRMASSEIYIALSECYVWNTRQLHVIKKAGFRMIGTRRNEIGEEIIVLAWWPGNSGSEFNSSPTTL